ncbi:MAG: hypothetical protein ACTS27_10185, partial [Phycisphaerales bacterium]
MRSFFLAAGLAVAASTSALAEVPASALEDVKAALAESDADTSTLTRLVMMLRDMGDHAQADALLADLAKSGIELDLVHDFSGGNVIPGYEDEMGRGTIGPDVIVGDLNGIGYYGQADGVAAYAIGTTSCNIGDTLLLWVSNTNQHPVIGQNLYRLKDGVFQQVGMSHLKHGFLALTGSLCSPCQGPGGSQLSPGCSDPYSTGLNAGQSRLGPKWQVNAYNGFYPYPFNSVGFPNPATGRRLQVDVDNVNPAMNSGAVYWGEGHYVTPDDATAGNGLNNASYRRVQFSTSLNPSWIGSTIREKPAIVGWQDYDAEVNLVNADVPGEGRFIVASRVYDNGDGTYLYSYAVHNLNSDRSGQAFSIDTAADVTDVGFHSPFYHSGDGINGNTYPNTDWAAIDRGSSIAWESETFAENNNANALRWGTTYSYWFTSTEAPEMTDATITLFKPGTPTEVTVQVVAPAGCAITADTNGDNIVNFADLNTVLGSFGDSGAGLP